MTVKLRKPILVGGIGLSLIGWLFLSFQHSLFKMGELVILSMMTLGALGWVLQNLRLKKNAATLSWEPITKAKAEAVIATTTTLMSQLIAEAATQDFPDLQQYVEQLSTSFERTPLQVAVTGGKMTGKTTLMQQLTQQEWNISLQWLEVHYSSLTTNNHQLTAVDNDVLLFLTTGDLSQSDWQQLQQLHQAHHHLILVFNKSDQYLSEERAVITQQIKQQVQSLITPENVITLSSAPLPIKVR